MKLDLKDIQREADQPQRPGDRRRRRAGQAVEALRPQPGLRRGRSPADGQGRRRAADRDAAAPTAAGAGSPAGASTPRRTPRPSSSTACRSPSSNDVALVPGVLERGVAWLKQLPGRAGRSCSRTPQTEPKDEPWKDARRQPRRLRLHGAGRRRASTNAEMRDFLYRDRTHLAVYAMAMFGLALDKQGDKEKLAMILRNIEPVRRAGRREPDGLPEPAREQLLVVLVRQRDTRPTPTT